MPVNLPESEFEMDDSQNPMSDPELQLEPNGAEPVDEVEEGQTLGSRITSFLRECWIRRRTVFCIFVAGTLISVVDALVQQNVYTSSTTLMPPGNSSPYPSITSLVSPVGSAANVLGSEMLGLSDPGDLFVSILKSRNVQDGLINRFGLADYYKTSSIDDARKSLMAATKIDEDRRSGVITISVTDRDPVLAAKIARGYAEELNRVVADNTMSSARRERIFLEERVKDIKQQLDDSARQLSQFSTKSGAIDMPSQTKSMVDEGLRLQAELIDGRSQLAALLQTYSADNSRVKALEAHNAELQREIDKMGGVPQGSGTDTDADKSPYPTAEELPALGLTYYDLERKMRVDEALWEALTRQYEAAKVDEAAEIPTVQILDVANIPDHKSAPIRRVIVEIGAMLSLVVACIVVLAGMIWEGMDADDEPKRLITDAVNGIMNPRWRIWALPGMSWVHRHLTGSEQPG
jgi:uncharacterized protein involved in exopolysaccharide biosynthesis